MKLNLQHVTGSPKSTIVGVCVLGISALSAVHFDVAGQLAMTPRDWTAVGLGIMTAVVSGLSQDADKQLAKVPGQTEPLDGDSHAPPDDPSAKAVVSK